MNDLQVFTFEKQQVRIVDRNGDPWFIAKDVCDILGIQNPTQAVENFPGNERSALSITYTSSNGVQQKREMNIVNEPGLYRLVFQSRKPEAEAFKTWVFTEVLPSIRKKGFYAAPGNDRVEQDEWKKNYPYPFLLLDDAAVKLKEFRLAVNKGTMTIKEWRKAVLGTGKMPYTPISSIKSFLQKNIVFTGFESDYVKIDELYGLFEKQNTGSISQQKFTREVKEIYPAIIHKQKKIDGYPVLVFLNCKLIRKQVKAVSEKEANYA